jgi:hypothetical protein
MPGRPLASQVTVALAARAARDVGEGATALDYVVYFLESGGTILKLASELEADLGGAPSRQIVSHVVHRLSDDAPKRVADARRVGATAMVEEAVQIIDDADTSRRETLQHAKHRGDVRLWLAERSDPSAWGATAKLTGNVSFGDLYLEALRQPRAQPQDNDPALSADAPPTSS